MDSFYDGIRMKSFLMIHCKDVSFEKFPDEVGVDALVNINIERSHKRKSNVTCKVIEWVDSFFQKFVKERYVDGSS